MTPGLAVLSRANQGLLLPRVSIGKTTDPGKGVGDGIVVAVAVGSGVNVGGMAVAVEVDADTGKTGVEAEAHPLNRNVSMTNARNTD